MSVAEQKAASIDAQLYFLVWLLKAYQEFKVAPGEEIEGKATYLVSANDKDEPLPLSLYFDQQSGLPLRLVRFAELRWAAIPRKLTMRIFALLTG